MKMKYGVYTSNDLEIAQTKKWALCFYNNDDKSIIGAELYKGEDNKKLIAICKYNKSENKTLYSYKDLNGQKFTNDFNGVHRFIDKPYEYDINNLRIIEDIEIVDPYPLPTVSKNGIKDCLKQWRMGTSYNTMSDGFSFQMVTNKIEYVFSIQNNNCNIYCGASINVPYDEGLFGGGQYFRIRNYSDNSRPYCQFISHLGNDIAVPDVTKVVCKSDECTVTSKGLYWPLKRYTENEIVLNGCGGEEYIYNKNNIKSEYFNVC